MFAAMLLSVATSLAPPLLAGLAVNDVKDGDIDGLTLIVVVFLVAALFNWGSSYLETFLVNFLGQRVLQDLRIQIFAHLQRLSIGFYSRSRAGVLISRLTNDVEGLNQLVTAGNQTIGSPRRHLPDRVGRADPRRHRHHPAGARHAAGVGDLHLLPDPRRHVALVPDQ